MAQCNDMDRDAFEAWLVTDGGWAGVPEKRESGAYVNGQAQARWIGWQAALQAERAWWRGAMQMRHRYEGQCPDDATPDARDPHCDACVALISRSS